MNERTTDRELVARAQRGDSRAFGVLMKKCRPRLARLLSRFVRDPAEVEDVMQEAFLKAYRGLAAFRGDSAFYTWLYVIGVNTARNYLKAMDRRPPTSTEVEAEDAVGFDDGEQLRGVDTPENVLLTKEIAIALGTAMEKLPGELRTAIVLRDLELLDYECIARRMGSPVGTVRSRIFRAREAVAEQLRPLLDARGGTRW